MAVRGAARSGARAACLSKTRGSGSRRSRRHPATQRCDKHLTERVALALERLSVERERPVHRFSSDRALLQIVHRPHARRPGTPTCMRRSRLPPGRAPVRWARAGSCSRASARGARPGERPPRLGESDRKLVRRGRQVLGEAGRSWCPKKSWGQSSIAAGDDAVELCRHPACQPWRCSTSRPGELSEAL